METNTQFLRKDAIIESRYVVDSLLGMGGSGWVLRVRDRLFGNQFVALKVLYPHLLSTENALRRFHNEVSISRRLSHPNIVQTFGFGRTKNGLAYVAMEYIEGKSLRDALDKGNSGLPLDKIEEILLQITEGLICAHRQGIIHRDLKPHNILINSSGTVKIVDFGLAQTIRQESHLTKTGNVAGSAQYMSPEQILGHHLNQQSDIYSLGILAYELASARLPFQGETVFELANLHLNEALPKLNDKPQWFVEFLERATAKTLQQRFRTMEEIKDFILPHLSFKPAAPSAALTNLSASAPTHLRPISKWARTHRKILLPASLFIVTLITTIGVSHNNNSFRHHIATQIFRLEKYTSLNLAFLGRPFGLKTSFHDNTVPFSANVDQLLKRAYLYAGMDPNFRDPQTKDCLFHRILEDGLQVTGQFNAFHHMANRAADFNLLDGNNMTPLLNAIAAENLQLTKLLLENGASPNIPDPEGWSPLARVVESGKASFSRLLLKFGADPNFRLPGGKTALHIAAQYHELEHLKLLFLYKADPNLLDALERPALFRAIGRELDTEIHKTIVDLLAKQTDLSLVDSEGKNALELAKESGDSYAATVIEKLLKKNPNK